MCGRVLMLTVMLISAVNSNADTKLSDTSKLNLLFDVFPSKCVALTKGRTCYLKLNATWQSDYPLSVCLYASNQQQHLGCWQEEKQGKLSLSIEMDDDIRLFLKSSKDKHLMAEQLITLNWVYEENSRKRKWRLF